MIVMRKVLTQSPHDTPGWLRKLQCSTDPEELLTDHSSSKARIIIPNNILSKPSYKSWYQYSWSSMTVGFSPAFMRYEWQTCVYSMLFNVIFKDMQSNDYVYIYSEMFSIIKLTNIITSHIITFLWWEHLILLS